YKASLADVEGFEKAWIICAEPSLRKEEKGIRQFKSQCIYVKDGYQFALILVSIGKVDIRLGIVEIISIFDEDRQFLLGKDCLILDFKVYLPYVEAIQPLDEARKVNDKKEQDQ
ncbi:MAG: hypothetical protein EZS28_011409, partial [Streblomastix strix]